MTLDEFVREALLSHENGGATRVSSDTSSALMSGTDTLVDGTGMLVIGIGTAGTKIVERLPQLAGPGLRTLTINSDRELFENSSASSQFFLKHTYFSAGFGLCGGDPNLVDRYAQAARTASHDIEPLLGHPEFCFIVAGMGGNMGTGAAPVIARMMRERGAIVTAIVTRPFAIERRRNVRAEQGISELGKTAHTVLILEFEKLKAVLPRVMVLPQQLSVMNHIITLSIRNIWECTYSASFVNFECEDLHYMLEHGKSGTLLVGEFPLNEKQSCRTLSEIQVPLMDFPVHEVKGCIIHITAGNDICLFETDQLAMMVSEPFDLHAEVISGATIRNEMDGKVRLISIITGQWECGREPEKPGTFPVDPEPKKD